MKYLLIITLFFATSSFAQMNFDFSAPGKVLKQSIKYARDKQWTCKFSFDNKTVNKKLRLRSHTVGVSGSLDGMDIGHPRGIHLNFILNESKASLYVSNYVNKTYSSDVKKFSSGKGIRGVRRVALKLNDPNRTSVVCIKKR